MRKAKMVSQREVLDIVKYEFSDKINLVQNILDRLNIHDKKIVKEIQKQLKQLRDEISNNIRNCISL